MKQFKEEFKDCKVTINTHATGRMTIDTSTADANEWGAIKEFEFMTEDLTFVPKSVNLNKAKIADEWEDFTINELRERFPDIKATSKAKFIELIGG